MIVKVNNKGYALITVIGVVLLFLFLLIMVSIMINNLTSDMNRRENRNNETRVRRR